MTVSSSHYFFIFLTFFPLLRLERYTVSTLHRPCRTAHLRKAEKTDENEAAVSMFGTCTHVRCSPICPNRDGIKKKRLASGRNRRKVSPLAISSVVGSEDGVGGGGRGGWGGWGRESALMLRDVRGCLGIFSSSLPAAPSFCLPCFLSRGVCE